MKLRYGGELKIGDFIMVAYGHYTSFGWYCGQGPTTLQYYYFRVPGDRYNVFQQYEAGTLPALNHHLRRKYERHGCTLKALNKEYVYGWGVRQEASRIVKITDPEIIFTEPHDLEDYRKSKEALIHFKFPVR